MAEALPHLLQPFELALLTAAYFAVDVALRRSGFLVMMRRFGVLDRSHAGWLFLVACAGLAPFWPWQGPAVGAGLRALGVGLLGMLTWKATTKDIDIVLAEGHGRERLTLLLLAVGCWFSPAFLLAGAFLLSHPFGLWEHHSTLPMRVLQALCSYLMLSTGLATTGLFTQPTVFVFFAVMMLVSHYFITALAKALLGPRWYSWVTDNRLHHMPASAYSWGWGRFVPWRRWLRVIRTVRRVERPLQLTAFSIELLAPLALLDAPLAVVFCLAWAGFHLGVFALSGLLFWDWVLTDLLMAWVITQLPADVAAAAFGPLAVIVGLVFMVAFPLRHRLWKPMPLGWFDTPFTQRIHWQVDGQSGRRYGLYNDFMCPHERLYGKVHGCFMAPVPVLTYHLGEVWKPELRDALRATGGDPAQLDSVRERFGIAPRNRNMEARHVAYLRSFFAALAQGRRKRYLPRWLRFLKAPGDQIFYWGELPAYRGQEPVTAVHLRYREEFFDGAELKRVRDDEVLSFRLDPDFQPLPVHELTPKQMDDYLLGLARGRLLDLPGFRADYVHGDDGRVSPA